MLAFYSPSIVIISFQRGKERKTISITMLYALCKVSVQKQVYCTGDVKIMERRVGKS